MNDIFIKIEWNRFIHLETSNLYVIYIKYIFLKWQEIQTYDITTVNIINTVAITSVGWRIVGALRQIIFGSPKNNNKKK